MSRIQRLLGVETMGKNTRCGTAGPALLSAPALHSVLDLRSTLLLPLIRLLPLWSLAFGMCVDGRSAEGAAPVPMLPHPTMLQRRGAGA